MRLKSIAYYGIGLLVVAYLFGNLVETVRKNYDLKLQVATLQQENALIQTQNDALRYQITYYKTPDYIEKAARAKLGLQQPGENVIILPNAQAAVTAVKAPAKVKPKSNFQQWMDFLSGRA